ncbi:hypothetical protein FOE78_16650 [Microlunatus elymi]|uniref:Cellulose synthase n=1 Tax=Microlunatus elymi TaxID=2596828 RepID=A0A516Q1N5_9ACTN|nr:hypothetical protein [Microlunatus elymi]QDP97333.1 hypothetical protein FOE78_16650 [Microlunatus elymi]
MPQADTVLLPICVAIALIGVILAGLAWRRGNKGRVLQAAALVIIPFGLYLTGFLRVIWDFVVEIVRWAFRLVFSPTLWIGFALIAFCVALFVVGLVISRLSGDTKAKRNDRGPKKSVKPAGSGGKAVTTARSNPAADEDPEMAEIEALLKSRGID